MPPCLDTLWIDVVLLQHLLNPSPAPTLTLSGSMRSAAPLPHTLILNSVTHFKHFITETSPPLATSCPVEGALDQNEPWTLGRSESVPSSLS